MAEELELRIKVIPVFDSAGLRDIEKKVSAAAGKVSSPKGGGTASVGSFFKDIFEPLKGAKGLGGIGNAMKGMGGAALGEVGVAVSAISAGVDIVVQAITQILTIMLAIMTLMVSLALTSKFGTKVFENMGKGLMRILSPLGDMIGMIFYPTMVTMRLLGQFLRAMWAPFRKDIMSALRLQAGFLKLAAKGVPGSYEKSIEAGAVAFGYMMLPFFNFIIDTTAYILKSVTSILGDLMKTIINISFDIVTIITNTILDIAISIGKGLDSLISSLTMGAVITNIGGDLEALKTKVTGEGGILPLAKDAAIKLVDDTVKAINTSIDTWATTTKDAYKLLLDNTAIVLAEDLKKMEEQYKKHEETMKKNGDAIVAIDNGICQAAESIFRIRDSLNRDVGGTTTTPTTGKPDNTTTTPTTDKSHNTTTTPTTTGVIKGAGQSWIDKAWGQIFGGDFIMRGNTVTRFNPQDTVLGFKGNAPMGNSVTVNVPIDARELSTAIKRDVEDYINKKLSLEIRGI